MLAFETTSQVKDDDIEFNLAEKLEVMMSLLTYSDVKDEIQQAVHDIEQKDDCSLILKGLTVLKIISSGSQSKHKTSTIFGILETGILSRLVELFSL